MVMSKIQVRQEALMVMCEGTALKDECKSMRCPLERLKLGCVCGGGGMRIRLLHLGQCSQTPQGCLVRHTQTHTHTLARQQQ